MGNHRYAKTNKGAPEDAGGICAECGESRDPTARRFTRRGCAAPARGRAFSFFVSADLSVLCDEISVNL